MATVFLGLLTSATKRSGGTTIANCHKYLHSGSLIAMQSNSLIKRLFFQQVFEGKEMMMVLTIMLVCATGGKSSGFLPVTGNRGPFCGSEQKQNIQMLDYRKTIHNFFLFFFAKCKWSLKVLSPFSFLLSLIEKNYYKICNKEKNRIKVNDNKEMNL